MNGSLFTAPYKALPVFIFALFVLWCTCNPDSAFYTHHLTDPDDYMRLDEVVSWITGQSWYDLSVPRLSPGAHTVIHWSRLVDIPIAVVAQAFLPFMNLTNAVFAAGLIIPLLWFAVLLAVLAALGKNLVGRDRGNLACIMVLFAPLLLFNYSPGRVGHHGIQMIIAGFGLFSLCKIIQNDKASEFAIASAFTFACGFWIGTEAFPWAILFIACLSIAAAWQGGAIARSATIFGIYLTFFTTLLIPIALPVSDYSSLALSWFSPAYAIFAALTACLFIIGWIIAKNNDNKFFRLFIYALLGIGVAAAFFILIPSAWRGPFADYDRFDATIALDNISEAIPLIKSLHFNRFMPVTLIPVLVIFSRLLFLPLVAFLVCLTQTYRAYGASRLIWLAQSIFLGTAFALTLFWQMRVGFFMELFSLAPLTHLLCAWWAKLRWGLWDRPVFWAEICVFLLLGPLSVFILPSLAAKLPFYQSDNLPPACSMKTLEPVVNALNDPTTLGTTRHTIMNVSDLAPPLLLYTQHNVVSGNFDVPGNQDAYTFFHARDDAQAQQAAQKWNADLVLICNNAPTLYLDKDYYAPAHMHLQKGKDGMLHLTNTDPEQPLIERLIRGQTPSWLKQIEISGNSDYLLFEIQYPAGTK